VKIIHGVDSAYPVAVHPICDQWRRYGLRRLRVASKSKRSADFCVYRTIVWKQSAVCLVISEYFQIGKGRRVTSGNDNGAGAFLDMQPFIRELEPGHRVNDFDQVGSRVSMPV